MKDITTTLFDIGISSNMSNFIGREEETYHLESNFINGINTVLISPRRWGKTSLVNHVREALSDNESLSFVYLDIFACKNEYDFYKALTSAIFKQAGSGIGKVWNDVQDFFSRITPSLSVGTQGTPEYKLSFDFHQKNMDYESILSIPEKVAQKTGRRMIICLDEFQQVGEFPDSEIVQRKLRGVWQLQKYTRYCLFGSRRHMMMNMFQDVSMPFFQFGDVIHLERIPSQTWVKFICDRFSFGGKHIDASLAERICSVTECYSAYVQQLAYFTYMYAPENGDATEEAFSKAVDALILSNEPQFMQVIEPLTSYQMNFLKAILCGHVKDYGMESVRTEFHLGSSSNISRLKQTLIGKDVIDSNMRELSIPNPVFRMWLSRRLL